MLRERVKTSVILLLVANMIFLTSEIWFIRSPFSAGELLEDYIRSNPVISRFFQEERIYSVPKENLSKPRKLLINDGSLWMAYYNTDIGYAPLQERTGKIIEGFLRGDIITHKAISYNIWEEGLTSLSVYIEYPIAFSITLLCDVFGIDSSDAPQDIKQVRDFIILPSDDKNNIYLLVRDASDNSAYAYMLTDDYSLPAEDLSVYTNSSDGYYEPAFSTGLELAEKSNITLSPLVLFSDSQPETKVLLSQQLLNENSVKKVLNCFSFNPISANSYTDSNGAVNHIANYGTAVIYPDGMFEYRAIDNAHGISLGESTDAFSALNYAIDFAEKVWKQVSQKPLSVLVTSDLLNYDSTKPYTFKFDYYSSGRPVEISLNKTNGHEKMTSAIEITMLGTNLISYRQYMHSYTVTDSYRTSATFLDALDYFVNTIKTEDKSSAMEISDIYIGYMDDGSSDLIRTSWLAKVSRQDKIYSFDSIK